MAEESFPTLEAPLSNEQWKSVARGFGTGVLDEGGNPYNLTGLDNASNTAVISVDSLKGYNHAIVSGYYHKMTAPETISIPAVRSTTTYYIVLQYNPFNSNGYVKLAVLTALDTSNSKENLVLWEVTRQPNQLLTESSRVKKRPIIVPTIVVDNPDALPHARTQLWGTRAFSQQTNEEFRASYSNTWEPISGHRVAFIQPPGWQINSPTYGLNATPTTGGFNVSAAIVPIRRAATYDIGTSFSDLGTIIPAAYRPPENVFALANMGDAVHEVKISPSGVISIRGRLQGFTFKRDESFSVQVSWFVARKY